MTRAAVAVLIATVPTWVPRAASACATCISSGYGDRSYTLAYLGLILMPFVIAVAIVATLAWHAGWRLQHVTHRISAWIARRWQRPARADLSPRTHTETP